MGAYLMRAIQAVKAGEAFVVAKLPVPDPAPGQVRVNVHACGSVAGWYSGNAKDSEDTMAFAALKGVRPMVETHPLESAEETFQNMGKAQFRAVLTI